LIGQEHLPPELTGTSPQHVEQLGMDTMVRCAEEQAIVSALKKNGYNRAAAARELGVHKTTLFRKIKSLGIELRELTAVFPKPEHSINIATMCLSFNCKPATVFVCQQNPAC
jgi:lipoate-protein ligase B